MMTPRVYVYCLTLFDGALIKEIFMFSSQNTCVENDLFANLISYMHWTYSIPT